MNEDQWSDYLECYPIIPDLTFLLYSTDVKSLVKRMNERKDVIMDHFDNAPIQKLNHMQWLFDRLSRRYNRIIPINSDRSIDAVAHDIWSHYIVNKRS